VFSFNDLETKKENYLIQSAKEYKLASNSKAEIFPLNREQKY
jgi:hypothetical protein